VLFSKQCTRFQRYRRKAVTKCSFQMKIITLGSIFEERSVDTWCNGHRLIPYLFNICNICMKWINKPVYIELTFAKSRSFKTFTYCFAFLRRICSSTARKICAFRLVHRILKVTSCISFLLLWTTHEYFELWGG